MMIMVLVEQVVHSISHHCVTTEYSSWFKNEGNKVIEMTADFRTRLWAGHQVYAKIMTVEVQMSTRSA